MQYLIVGGGIIGMMTAYMLRNKGADVTLLERHDTGQESTWAGGGILSPLYPWRYPDSITQLTRRSQQLYPELIQQLHELTNIDAELVQSGMLVIAPDEEQAAQDWAAKYNADIIPVSGQQIETLEERFEPTVPSALWMPQIGQVRNPRIAKALRAALEKSGVQVLTEQAVLGITQDNARVTSVKTAEHSYSADHVILCAGAWTADLIAQFSDAMPIIEPVRGQMLLFKGPPDTLKRITLWEDRYAIPRKDGRVLFGSTLEYTGFIKQTTAEAKAELHAEILRRYPVVEHLELEQHWAGLRPGSPAGVPYITRHPEFDNLYLHAGHFRNGLVMAPASAELLVGMLEGNLSEKEYAPYAFNAERS